MTVGEEAKVCLDAWVRESRIPGFQYIVLDRNRAIFEHVGGWADIRNSSPMTHETTLMAYSMSKTITAAAALQLVEQGVIDLDAPIDKYINGSPYGAAVRVRHLIAHTSGIPNPVPLRWVHPVERHGAFDEAAALEKVLHQHPTLRFGPGTKFLYSNIGYWLLGRVIANTSGQLFEHYVSDHLISSWGISTRELGYEIANPKKHARGYLEKYSFVNLIKGLVTDRELWGEYEGPWLQIKGHYVNGPAFGGLIGTARGFAAFLRDQLRETSALSYSTVRGLFYKQQALDSGKLIPMTLGWHMDEAGNLPYFYKEGGGGGFHCEMRVYPTAQLASVLMINATTFNVRRALSILDREFLGLPRS